MKIAICAVLLLNLSLVRAFLLPVPVGKGQRIAMAMSSQTQQQHLNEKWEEFMAKEKQLEEADDEVGALKLAIEMLETAMDYVHTEEEVEEEHFARTRKALERVLKTEKTLEENANVAHHDADEADSILEKYTELGEDRQKRRELAVSDLAHHVESYANERLHQAGHEEKQLHEEEDAVTKELRHLQLNELVLNEALGKLRAVQRAKESM